MKIEVSKNEIIALFLIILLVKLGLYFYPIAESHFDESAYVAVTQDFEKKTVQDLEAEGKEATNNVFYIGRPSCIDCRVAIKNTRKIHQICEKTNRRMYYVRLDDKISDSERKYLDSISVDSIPTIVAFRDGKVVQFEYDDIISEQFIERFNVFARNL